MNTEGGATRVAIDGGTPAVRAGLAAMLAARPAFEVIAGAGGDVILAVGPEAVRRTGGRLPVVAVVDGRDEAAAALAEPGVAGVLAADADGDQVAAALEAAVAGLFVASPSLGLATASSPVVRTTIEGEGGDLTAREREVLSLIADGLPNKAIATRLGISENTVKFHAGAILAKLGASSRAEAVMLAARRGLLAV